MTAWDLAMDPMMVAGGHWVWEQPGAYFGIPLQNYWGWWLTTFVTFWLFLSLARIHPEQDICHDPFNHLPLWSYAITGLSSLLADFNSAWMVPPWWASSPCCHGLSRDGFQPIQEIAIGTSGHA